MGLVILDVAIGLILVYLVLSLVGTAITEMIAQKTGKRAACLREGITALLGRQLTDTFYDHRLIRNLSREDKDPSYIASATFAEVILDRVSAYVPADGVKPASLRECISAFVADRQRDIAAGGGKVAEAKLQADLGHTLLAFWDESLGDRARLVARIEGWFNDAMDRVSGWYRRWAQRTLLWTAVLLALALNANTARMVRVLYGTPVLRELLVEEAKSRVQRPEDGTSAATVDNVKKEIATIQPILGWSEVDLHPAGTWGESPSVSAWTVFGLETVAGFFVTVLAVSMGASFWFRALSQLLRVRARITGAEDAKPEAGSTAAGPTPPAGPVPAPAQPERAATFPDSFDPDATRHSHANAYWLGKASELAYQDGTGFKAAVAAWGLECRYVTAGDTQVHVAAAKDRMIVAFRGTETNPGDMASDARFKRVGWDGPGHVHQGFLEALDVVWDRLVASMEEISAPGQTLWFTGHSLGGALAVLAAMRWTAQGRKPSVNGLYTIGQPRVGDKALADQLGNKLGERAFRYINNRDVVPRVPLRAMGYADAGRVLYFDSSGRLHTDPALWFRLLDVAFTDLDRAKESLKEAVGDHSAVEYVERLRRAAAG